MEPNYLAEGVQQAAQARDMVGWNWTDTWKNYAVNYALNKQTNDQQLELWNLMNEYNLPENQMKRFKDAGLNPNLIYQQGSPGNTSSPANYTPMTANITPNADINKRISAAMDVIGMVNNLSQNIVSLMDSGLNLQLKRNQVERSNFDINALHHVYGVPGVSVSSQHQLFGDNGSLNPLSERFDPLQFYVYQQNGGLPQFWNQFLSGVSDRTLKKFKSDYQKYYNDNLLPKFNEYQQGKIDLQELEKQMQNYEYEVTSMLPPEIRGILEPMVQYISPFLKFIFKRSTFKRN